MKSSAPSRLPRAPTSSRATMDPVADKENACGPPEKKRKLASLDPAPPTRRATLGGLSARKDSVNGRPPVAPAVQTVPEPQWEGISSASMNVEELLSMKMMGKGKFDYKGKSEQMMEYIKKLRACIRNFQQLEQGFLMEKDSLQADVAKERTLREDAATAAARRQIDLETEVAALKQNISELERRLSDSQAENASLQAVRQSNGEALAEAAGTKSRLTADLSRAQAEIATLTEQGAAMRDINTRLQEYNTSLQSYNSKLQGDTAAAQQTLLKVQEERALLVEEMAAVKGQNAALQAQLEQAMRSADEAVQSKQLLAVDCERARAEVVKVAAERDERAAEGKALAAENARYRECTGKSAAEMESLANKATALEESFSSQAELIAGLRRQIEVGSHKVQLAEGLAEQRRAEADGLQAKCTDLEAQLAEAETKVADGEEIRRKLHNTIQELKGNIRVFCRVRPPLPEDEKESAGEAPVLQYPTSAELAGRGVELVPATGPKYPFAFDKVFGPEAPQAEVFQEISMLVQSALDGYKVCIFAYGQTGSGKTHTMLGVPQPAEARGMIPRSLEQIFQASQHLAAQGWKFTMQASMLEIYNESLRDLLGPASAQKDKAGDAGGKAHAIKHDAQGNTTVADLTLVEVATWHEVELMMQKAAQSRTVGRTAMNERSSRSHCVFTLRIAGSNETTEQTVNGVLNLIDLAGSERLSRSGATGDRLKETQAINKSLSCLGDVISAIANRDAHVPYRNSKLTYLLQPCLGGDSKTLMFVNIAPDRSSFNESLCSLRFAAKVNSCEIGVPRRQARVKDASGQ